MTFLHALVTFALLTASLMACGAESTTGKSEPVTKTLVWPDGTRYVGGVLNGERSGKGTIFWDDGTRFVGQFRNDMRNGPGTMILPDGTVFTGFFKDDVLVDTTETLSAGDISSEEKEVIPSPVSAIPEAEREDLQEAVPEPVQEVATPEPEQAPTPSPAVTKAQERVTAVTPDVEEALITAVNRWASAWSRQDVEGYLAAYSRDFQTPRGGSRSAWANQRRIRLTRPAYIRIGVTFERFELVAPDVVEVQFSQDFESNTYSDTSTKILQMRHEQDSWKILEERSINIER